MLNFVKWKRFFKRYALSDRTHLIREWRKVCLFDPSASAWDPKSRFDQSDLSSGNWAVETELTVCRSKILCEKMSNMSQWNCPSPHAHIKIELFPSCIISSVLYICRRRNLTTWNMSRLMTKPTKWLCAQRRLRSSWASAQSDQSLRCPHEENLGF